MKWFQGQSTKILKEIHWTARKTERGRERVRGREWEERRDSAQHATNCDNAQTPEATTMTVTIFDDNSDDDDQCWPPFKYSQPPSNRLHKLSSYTSVPVPFPFSLSFFLSLSFSHPLPFPFTFPLWPQINFQTIESNFVAWSRCGQPQLEWALSLSHLRSGGPSLTEPKEGTAYTTCIY